MQSEQQYIDIFRQARQMLDSGSAPVINAQRNAAFEAFCRNGLPTRRVEDYRYTDVQSLLAPDYGLNLQRLDIPVNPNDVFRCDVPNLSTLLYFVVNDQFCKKFLPKAALPEGIEVCSLSDYASKTPHFIEKYYTKLADSNADSITALNTMLAQDGLVIRVKAGCHIDKVIQIINILRADVDLMVNRRVLVVAEEGSEASLIFCDHAIDQRSFLATQVVEVFVEQGASLSLYCLEETHHSHTRLSNVYVRQAEDSRFSHHCITLQNGITRNRLVLDLAGKGAQCYLGGLVIADAQQHVDNNTLITHSVPGCTSDELYKYVLDGESVGAFAGKVLVKEGAGQTSSNEVNQNLCTSAGARMYTQPMLEIYADDVKCSHGSTVGQLSEAALFYMRQRGISLDEARRLLQIAFAAEVVDRVQLAPLRDRLHYLVEKRFRGELGNCKECHRKLNGNA